MRIGIVGIMHESNTFAPEPTTFDLFEQDVFLVGEALREQMSDTHHEVSSFFRVLDEAGVEAVPLMFARALPAGTITADTLEKLMTTIKTQLDNAGELDGVLAAPHGANVSEDQPDMDGYWLSKLREWVGPDTPIISTLDPHANLTPKMVDAVDAFVAYRTNPHLDQRARGDEAARLVLRAARNEIKPTMCAAFPPVAINIERQAPHQPPCKPLYDLADEMKTIEGVLTNSITLGFAYSDVYEMGSAFLVVTDDQPELAQQLANQLAAYLVEHRDEFVGEFITAGDAVKAAMEGEGPVCLLDMGDNVGGGSPGDGALIGKEFEAYVQATGVTGKQAFLSLWDAAAAKQAIDAGVGKRLTLSMGGKKHELYGDPLELDVTVVSVHEGKFTESQVRHYAMTHFDMGPTAIVKSDNGLVVQLTSERVYPTSLNQLISCGIRPEEFQILVAKGVHAPVAAYKPVSARIIRVNTPGVTCADMRELPYHHRRKPLFPFEQISD